jgi:hypothetical protein
VRAAGNPGSCTPVCQTSLCSGATNFQLRSFQEVRHVSRNRGMRRRPPLGVSSVGPALRSWWKVPSRALFSPGARERSDPDLERDRSVPRTWCHRPLPDDDYVAPVAAATQASPAQTPPAQVPPVAEHEPQSTSTEHYLSPPSVHGGRRLRIVGKEQRRIHPPHAVSWAAAALLFHAQGSRTRTCSSERVEGSREATPGVGRERPDYPSCAPTSARASSTVGAVRPSMMRSSSSNARTAT